AAWLNESPKRSKRRPHLTRLLQHLWRQRPDLQRIFPDPAGDDLSDFSAWALDYGRHEFTLDDAFLATLARPSRADLFTLKGIRRRLINRAKRLWNGKLGLRARELAKRLLGHRRTAAIRRATKGDDAPVAVASPSVRPVTPTTIDRFGVNVIGYLRAETGMGQAARALVRALETTDVPVASYDLDLNVLARRDDTSVTGSLQAADTTADPEDDESLPYDINLLVVNADQVAAVREHLGAEAFADRWTIGYWLWELELFPERFWGAFDHLHEVWTASTFCLDAMSAVAPIPMRRMPIPVTLAAGSERFTRADFDLDDDVFVVLFLFNFLSYGARKNPLAAVQAFRQAFAGRDDVLLVLKSAHADFAPEAREALDREGADVNVRLIDRYMDRAEIDGLIRCSDVYLSLHRSEGFGLTVAEAMAAGKPVVATQYGGVTDFFNAANGYPIAYELITLEEDEGPYPAGARWADPDIDLAARRLRQIHDDRDQAQRLASHARADIDRELSYATIGRQIADHMHRVARRIEHQRLGPGLPSR
ncbi:MAG: glycosyltransferase family 4 protein, partial [Acidobacteriota bacterium]